MDNNEHVIATLPFFNGTLIIKGTHHIVTDVYYVDKSSMQINGMEHAGPSVILGEETDTFKEQLWYLTQ